MRGLSATDSEAVVLRRHVLAGKRAQLLGECSGEHEVNVVGLGLSIVVMVLSRSCSVTGGYFLEKAERICS